MRCIKCSSSTLKVPPDTLLYVGIRCTTRRASASVCLDGASVGLDGVHDVHGQESVPKVDRQRKHAITTHGTREIICIGGGIVLSCHFLTYTSPEPWTLRHRSALFSVGALRNINTLKHGYVCVRSRQGSPTISGKVHYAGLAQATETLLWGQLAAVDGAAGNDTRMINV